MKISKHGKKYKTNGSEEFKCDNCGCEFTAEKDEYYIHAGDWPTVTTSCVIGYSITDYLVCSCPECHKIVKKTRTRPNTIYTPLTITSSGTNLNTKTVFDNTIDITCKEGNINGSTTNDKSNNEC